MRKNILFMGVLLVVALYAKSNEKPLDFGDEEKRLFGIASKGQHIDFDLSERQDINFVSKSFALDHSTKKVVISALSTLLAIQVWLQSLDLWQIYGPTVVGTLAPPTGYISA